MYEGMNEILCFEIKFHRNGSNKSEFPHTMSAGEVINDIFRLPQWAKVGINKPIRKFLLYVTDKEMHDYLSYKKTNVFSSQLYRNELKKFYDMAQNVTTSLNFNNVNAPKTFLSSATTSIGTIGITNLSLLFKGVVFIIILKVIGDKLGLVTVGLLLEYILEWGPIALIVIFQPEIRNVLEQLGRSQLLGRHKTLTVDEREKVVNELMLAIDWLKKNKIGALIVIEREVSLQEYIENSTKIYADVNSFLLETIFFPNSPLHDGGIIIQGDKVTCAGSVFKTSMNQNLDKRLGTRHRAALGIAEESDAIALIVSEETGRASIAINGEMNYNLSNEEFRVMLMEELSPKSETFFASDIKESEGEEE